MDKTYRFLVKDLHVNERVDSFLEKELISRNVDISRSFIQNYFDQVLVNDESRKKSYRLKKGDWVQFTIPELPEIKLIPEKIDFETIYEDHYLMVINKPAGLVVHPAKGNYTGTLVHGILHKLKESSLGESQFRPGIVHRLDKDTSGLMVVAKDLSTQTKLMTLFKNRELEKKYKALVKGITPLSGKIDSLIERHPVYRKKFRVGSKGKSALTFYQTIKHYEFFKEKIQNYSLIDVKIITGRTHQIRVHFSALGHPIVGDPIYSKLKSNLEKKGMALCAYQLAFKHPGTGKDLIFEIDLPSYFQEILKELDLLIETDNNAK